VVVALLLEDPRRLDTIVRYYGIFLTIYVPAVPFVFVISKYMTDAIPRWPGVNVPVLLVQPTEVAVHLAGAAVFVLVGFRKAPTVAIVGAAVALGMVFAASRGGMLAFVVPVVIAALVLRRIRELMMAAALGLAIFIAAPALDAISDGGAAGTKREVSARQVVANLESLTGYSEEKLEGTKTWRLEWWNIILRHTVFGPNFWTGRGFGLNLADADGFQHRGDPKSPPLRSPHNVHMTVLARAGVPGATLWLLFLMSWGGTITNAMLAARRRGQATWAGLFLWIGCYALAAIINASFDVALEGPVQGVWFWCLMGFGMGAVMLYRCQGSLPSDWRLQRGAT
jgi:hypothetical protein